MPTRVMMSVAAGVAVSATSWAMEEWTPEAVAMDYNWSPEPALYSFPEPAVDYNWAPSDIYSFPELAVDYNWAQSDIYSFPEPAVDYNWAPPAMYSASEPNLVSLVPEYAPSKYPSWSLPQAAKMYSPAPAVESYPTMNWEQALAAFNAQHSTPAVTTQSNWATNDWSASNFEQEVAMYSAPAPVMYSVPLYSVPEAAVDYNWAPQASSMDNWAPQASGMDNWAPQASAMDSWAPQASAMAPQVSTMDYSWASEPTSMAPQVSTMDYSWASEPTSAMMYSSASTSGDRKSIVHSSSSNTFNPRVVPTNTPQVRGSMGGFGGF